MSNPLDPKVEGCCPACGDRKLRRRQSGVIWCCSCKDCGFTETEIKDAEHRKRGNEKRGEAGLTQMIRQELKAGPLTINQLSERLGKHRDRVANAVGQLCGITGGVYSRGSGRERTYALFEQRPLAETPEGSSKHAGRITIGRGFFWGAGLV